MPDSEARRAYQLAVDGFKALGATDSEATSRAVIFRERTFAGLRFRCDGMQAVWLANEAVVRFYDESGRMLKSAEVGAAERKAA